MNTTLETTEPEKIKFTLEVTMTLKEWKELAVQLEDSKYAYPAQQLVSEIRDMTRQARTIFYPKEEA